MPAGRRSPAPFPRQARPTSTTGPVRADSRRPSWTLMSVSCIYLDRHMLCGVYQECGIRLRDHRGAEPPRDIEPPGLVRAVGWRDRAAASHDAADRVEA